MTRAIHFAADLLDRAAHRMRKLAEALEYCANTVMLHASLRPPDDTWDDEACWRWKRANL